MPADESTKLLNEALEIIEEVAAHLAERADETRKLLELVKDVEARLRLELDA